jgi:hypothetical protein
MPSLQGVISNYFWEGAATKITEKIKSVGFVSEARLCHEHKMIATTNNFFFAKKEWPEKARNVLYKVWLLSFEPGPDANIICAVRLRPGGPCRPLPAPIKSLINPINIIQPYFSKINVNIALPFAPKCLEWSPPFRSPNQNFVRISQLSNALHAPPISSSVI